MAYTEVAGGDTIASCRTRTSSHADLWTALVLLAVAIATRAAFIGDPALGQDEDFYLLVGDRLWHGALPYVDIWDRKPIGLFLLFAAFRPFSSDGIIAYQIAALIFATVTAFVISRIACRLVSRQAATLSGCLYLLYLPVLGGVGGQAAVFYNLFIAIAALLVVKLGETNDASRAARMGLAAMLLVGMAMQIKPTCVFEGVCFGLWMVWDRWRRWHRPLDMVATAAGWIAVAILPTALVAGFYAATGHFGDFWFATVRSVLMKQEPAGFSELGYLRQAVVETIPLVAVACVAALRLLRQRTRPSAANFVLVWTPVAIYGFVSIGHYYHHYAQPTLLPLTILCGLMLEQLTEMVIVVSLCAFWFGCLTSMRTAPSPERHRQATAALVTAMEPYARQGCIYLAGGPVTIYLRTNSCFATKFVFPEHLGIASEERATGGPATMAALLARRPTAILWPDDAYIADYHRPRNTINDAMMKAALATNYHLKARLRDPEVAGHLKLFVRNDLP